ncbi:MAG TPA: D-Ala-D-Ala carboxypeptidase family metallohydrolase [Alphaproteobacteria bacterium]|nr:D-Ala-D-Ala carboxypeptidase family metallohydrolase [Alphaproteobacteria bacterium]
MATLPTVADMGRRPIPAPQRAIAQVSPRAASAVADAVSALGDEASRVGFEMIDREATAEAKDRDALVSDQIRGLLYDPQGGFMNLEGGTAVQRRQAVVGQLEGIKSKAMEGLSRPAQKKLQDVLDRRIESAMLSVDTHSASARKTWVAGASAARIESAYQDSLADPASTAANIGLITGELRGRAVDEGWAPEKLDLEVQKATSKVYNDQTIRIASTDPVAAMQYLRQNQDNMLPADVVNLEAKLQPAVKEFIGWQKGRELFANVSAPAMASFKALEDAIGYPLKVNSAFRDAAHNEAVGGAKGSQHVHGNAFDVDVSGMSVEQRQDLIRQARAAGFSGIGVYDNALHFDVGGDRAWGADYHRGSLPEWAAEAVTSPIGERPSMWDTVMAEEDPAIRKSMADAITLEQSIADGERKAELAGARDAAFQMIEAGGDVMKLPLEQRQMLGEDAMSGLLTYQAKRFAGEPVETDPQTYLTLRQLQANDPERFRNTDLTPYVGSLSETDWKKFVDAQTASPDPATKVTAAAASTMMETAKRQMVAAGIDSSPKEGTTAAKKVATIQMQLLQWQDTYIKENGEAPSQLDIDRRVAKMLTPVTINPPGPMNEKDVMAFELGGLGLDESALGNADIIVGDVTYPAARVDEAAAALRDAGLPVTAENLVTILGMVVQ